MAKGAESISVWACGALLAAGGCAHLAALPFSASAPAVAASMVAAGDGLPDRSEVTAGQLVIHADFPLAGQHRLVRELDGLRIDVSQELGLPVSDEPVHLYLFENTERYDAFVARRFPSFPARRAFFVETDTTLSVFAPWQDRDRRGSPTRDDARLRSRRRARGAPVA
jgi:hypothetical protein